MGTSWEVDNGGVVRKPLIVGDGAGQFVQVPKLTTVQRNALTPVNGMIVYDTDLSALYSYLGGAWQSVNPAGVVNDEQACFDPVVVATAASGQTGTNDFVGSAFRVPMVVQFNRFLMRLSGQGSGAGPGIAVLVYQTDDGLPGSGTNLAKLKATMGVASGLGTGAQNIELTPSEGTVTLLPGVCYILHGRINNGPSFYCYTAPTIDLLTTSIPTGSDWVAANFTTTIPSNTSPATFDPGQVIDGGEATPTNANTALVNRCRKV